MANKTTRAKDIITKQINNYLKSTTDDYIRYYQGSPTFITYFRLDSNATRQDSSLETVHSLVGSNTPNKYVKISNLAVYGVDGLDLQTIISNTGLMDEITGQLIIIPDSIVPQAGDFFIFEHEGLTDHLFIVKDVQYDRPSPRKYYKIDFGLYPDEVDLIFDNVTDRYVVDYDNIENGQNSIITEEDAEAKDNLRDISDLLTDRFVELFYDSDMDSFVYNTEIIIDEENFPDASLTDFYGEYLRLWSPYLQTFINHTGSMSKFNRNILEEFYIPEITQSGHPSIYTDKAYNNSIFGKIEDGRNDFTFLNNFMNIDFDVDLTKIRNLQFFNVPGYTLLGLHKSDLDKDKFHKSHNIEFFPNAINILDSNFTFDILEKTLDGMDDRFKLTDEQIDDYDYMNQLIQASDEGDTFYLMDSLLGVLNIPQPEIFKKINGSLVSADISLLLKSREEIIDSLVQDIEDMEAVEELVDSTLNYFKEYHPLFSLTREILNSDYSSIYDLYDIYLFENNLETYIFGPILIYLIKKVIYEGFDVEDLA